MKTDEEERTLCTHSIVHRGLLMDGGDAIWACQSCGTEFIPKSALSERDDLLDSVAAVTEAVIWGITERAIEKYGKETAMGAAVDDDGEEVKQCVQHVWVKDQCIVCGLPRFLGAHSDVR